MVRTRSSCCDSAIAGSFLRTFEAQFPLVLAFVQIVEAQEGQQEAKRTVRVAIEGLELVHASLMLGLGLR